MADVNATTKRKKKFSSNELMALLNAIKEDRKFILGPFNAEVDAKSKKEAWKRVTAKVNAVNISGNIRTEEKVQKRWSDLKFTAKSNVAKYRREMAKTGGGSINVSIPTEIELETVSVLGFECVDGIPGVSEIPWLNSITSLTSSDNVTTDLLSPVGLPQSSTEMDQVTIHDSERPLQHASADVASHCGHPSQSDYNSSFATVGQPIAVSTQSTPNTPARTGRKRKRDDEEDIVNIQRDIRDLLARMVQIMDNISQFLIQSNQN